MKVTTERLPKSVIALDIELDQQQVEKGLDRAARKLSQEYRIPGFRPGKAPRFIVENYLGRARIMDEASDDLINKAFQEALKEQQLTPVGRVNLENVEQEPFRFRVTIPVEPTVTLPEYRSYRFPYEPEVITEETVQRLLDAQREQHAVIRELDEARPAQAGDMLTVTMTSDLDEDDDEDEDDGEDEDDDAEFVNETEDAGNEDASDDEGDEVEETEDASDDEETEDASDDEETEDASDDEETEEASDEDDEDDDEDEDDEDDDEDEDDEDEDEEDDDESHQLALDEGRVRPEIYQALIGAQPGESREVTITYGDDDEDENLRGRTVTYTIDVKNVQERLLPEWDELPTLTSFEGDVEAMRTANRERLERASQDRVRGTLVNAFIDRAVEETQLDIPDAMIEERAHELFHQQVSQFSRYGITEEQYLTSMRKTHEEATSEFNEEAEKDVRRNLVLREIIRNEGIRVEESDLDKELERFLEDYDEARRAEMRTILEQDSMRNMLASAALDRKLRERLVGIATEQEEPTATTTDAPAASTESARLPAVDAIVPAPAATAADEPSTSDDEAERA